MRRRPAHPWIGRPGARHSTVALEILEPVTMAATLPFDDFPITELFDVGMVGDPGRDYLGRAPVVPPDVALAARSPIFRMTWSRKSARRPIRRAAQAREIGAGADPYFEQPRPRTHRSMMPFSLADDHLRLNECQQAAADIQRRLSPATSPI